MLRLVLRTAADDTKIGELGLDSLRFFLKGQSQHVYPLYELILNDALQIAVADSPLDKNPRLLDKSASNRSGFELDEGMLPYPAQSFPGYRLLSEFFAFPQKFLFFEITGLERACGAPGRARRSTSSSAAAPRSSSAVSIARRLHSAARRS